MADIELYPGRRVAFACRSFAPNSGQHSPPGATQDRPSRWRLVAAYSAILPMVIATLSFAPAPTAIAAPCPDGSTTCAPQPTQGTQPTQGNTGPTTAPQAPNTTVPGYTPPEMPQPTQGSPGTPTLQGTVMPMPTVTAPPDSCILNCNPTQAPAPTATQPPAPTVTQSPPTEQQVPQENVTCDQAASALGSPITRSTSGGCAVTSGEAVYTRKVFNVTEEEWNNVKKVLNSMVECEWYRTRYYAWRLNSVSRCVPYKGGSALLVVIYLW
ncbi:hypothetical protein HNP11_004162 [Tsukamurella ocularis]|nr:hypothetical protein [Tsukamurella ocularis]